VQFSTNAFTWLTLTNVVGVGIPITVVDDSAKDFSARFYRAVSP